jgi:hypothetical protein
VLKTATTAASSSLLVALLNNVADEIAVVVFIVEGRSFAAEKLSSYSLSLFLLSAVKKIFIKKQGVSLRTGRPRGYKGLKRKKNSNGLKRRGEKSPHFFRRKQKKSSHITHTQLKTIRIEEHLQLQKVRRALVRFILRFFPSLIFSFRSRPPDRVLFMCARARAISPSNQKEKGAAFFGC